MTKTAKKIRYQVRIVYETTKLYFVEAEDEESAQQAADDKFDKGEPGDDELDGWISVERYEIEEVPVVEDRVFRRGPWKLEWDHHGEGYDGDYNEDDPADKPLLRADLYYKNKMCCDGSYCTLAVDDSTTEQLQKYSNDLFDKLEHGMKTVPNFVDEETAAEDRFEEVHFNDRVMQEWTWRTEPAKSRSKAKAKRPGKKKVAKKKAK